ncbi:MAG: DEAD/DEAH box helicase family protein [Bacteroidales bacterium]|nr:DEAD/DEAH box helicase family protein [Bacteroidales bacterium]
MKIPYEWQRKAIQEKTGKEFFMLNCACGLGKTFVFISIAKQYKEPKIIIAPKNITYQWKNELLSEGVPEEKIWLHEQTEQTKKKEKYLEEFVEWAKNGGEYLIIATQTFSLNVRAHKQKGVELLPQVVQLMLGLHGKNLFVILDESSWIKANSPAKTQLSSRSQMIKLLGSLVKYKAAGTGTMMSKNPMNVYDQFEFLKPNFWSANRNEFFLSHCITKTNYFYGKKNVTLISKKEVEEIQRGLRNPIRGLSQYTGVDDGEDLNKLIRIAQKYNLKVDEVKILTDMQGYFPFKNLDKIYKQIEPFTVTVRREDVFDISFDKFIYEPIQLPVKMTEEQKKLYKSLVDNTFGSDVYLDKVKASELRYRLQDICLGFFPEKNSATGEFNFIPLKENPKLEMLIEKIKEIDEDEQVVVWVARKNAVTNIADRLTEEKISYVIYTGDQTSTEKREAERKMETKEARVFIGNINAGSFGLNALKDCNYLFWYCLNDSPERIHQAAHRILRGQSKNPKFGYFIYVENSFELSQFLANQQGEEFIKFRNEKGVFFNENRRRGN